MTRLRSRVRLLSQGLKARSHNGCFHHIGQLKTHISRIYSGAIEVPSRPHG